MKSWRPYTRESGSNPPLLVDRTEGAFLYLKNGQKVFDGISSWWLVTFGHAQAEIQEAIKRQSSELSQVVFANFNHEPAERLIDLLGRLLPPHFARAFFSDNGSTAVEVAMKMALQTRRLQGLRRRRKFLAFSRGYHGDTCGAMSVSARGAFTADFHDLLFEIVRCDQGQLYRDSLDNWLADFRFALERHEDEICAVILEPLIQGAGGMIAWPEAAVEEVCRNAHERGIFVIFDEVMTGFGRTGSAFAFERIPGAGLPDFLCLSKGLTGGFLPMGLTLTSEEIFSCFSENRATLFHGHSYTGNALSCAAAAANLELWLDRSPLPALKRIEETQTRALAPDRNRDFDLLETRVCGTIGAIALNPRSLGENLSLWASQLTQACLKDGVFVRPLGSTVYLMPPYCATDREIEAAWDVILRNIHKLASCGQKETGPNV